MRKQNRKGPQDAPVVIAFGNVPPFLWQHAARRPFHQCRHRHLRRVAHQEMHMVTFAVHFGQRCLEVVAYLGKQLAQAVYSLLVEYFAAIFCKKKTA